jgi:hypothetical protein
MKVLILSKLNSPDVIKITNWLSYMGIQFYVIWPTSVVRLIKLEFLSTGEVTIRLSIDDKKLDLDESVL